MELSIRQATPQDIETVTEILTGAARWLEERGIALWRLDELLPRNVTKDINSGLFFLALVDGEPAGTIRYQLEDPVFWPDVAQDDSAFRSSSCGEKTLCRRRDFLGLNPLSHYPYARSGASLSPFGLRSLAAAPAGGI